MTKISFETLAKLEEIGEISIQTGPFGTQLKASDYTEMGTPVINVRNIGYRAEKAATLERIPEKVVEKLKQHKLLTGDIVFGRKGAVDRHLIVKKKHTGWIQGSDCIRIRLKTKFLDRDFLSYFFLTEGHKKWIEAQGAFGATMGSLNQGIIKRISYPDYPFAIQHKIAAVLSAYDDLIENNNRRIAILEKMAEELYREWFVRLRFPGHEKTKNIKGIPEGWEVKKIRDLITFEKGKNPKNLYDESSSEREPYLTVDAIENRNLKFSSKKNSVFCEIDETIMLMDGARSSIVFNGQKGIVSSTFAVIRTKKELRPVLHEFFKANIGAMVSNNTGSAIPHANKKFIAQMLIKLPIASKLILSFNNHYSYLLNFSLNLRNKGVFLIESRDKLLSRLMSGKIDLENLDIQFPASMQEVE